MHSESFEEIFTYVGKAPKPTPEEKKRIDQDIKEMREDRHRQIREMKMGTHFDEPRCEEMK